MKIVMPRGYRVVRLEFTRTHLAGGLVAVCIALLAVVGSYAWTLERAEARVGALRSLTTAQRADLRSIDARAAALAGELHNLQRQDIAIERLMSARPGVALGAGLRAVGAHRAARGAFRRVLKRQTTSSQAYHPDDDFTTVAARIDRLRAASSRMGVQSAALRRLAIHIVEVRRLQELARVAVLAAIPSLNPAGDGVAIRSPFGWRADPWPEFHEGVDLDVDYGDNVRAAAAGTVVAASYDGGYGIKVDIDHGNGYHTWYAHLSRADVSPGQRVVKGQHIALVGSTGESTGPHLHYQVMLDGKAVDPTPYLEGVPAPVLANIRV